MTDSEPRPVRGSRVPSDWRSVLAVGLLIAEAMWLRRQFTTDHLVGLETWWAQLLVLTRYGMPFSLCILAGLGLASGRSLLGLVAHRESECRAGLGFSWPRWLLGHSLALGACFGAGAILFKDGAGEAALLWIWALSFCLALACLVLSLASLVVPLSELGKWLIGERSRLTLGLLAGLVVYAAGLQLLGDMPFWRPMGTGTMWLAHQMLGFVYPELVLDPKTLLLGTPGFEVRISRFCSGYEGAFLFIGFFTLFLFLSRKRLRFPRVLWLLPLGVLSVYLLNALRIALLVVVGTEFSEELAMEGFHVNAGWPFFGITAWLAVLIGVRSPYFSRLEERARPQETGRTVNVYGVYLAPMVVAIAAVMLSGSASRQEWVGDLFKLLGVGLVVLLYRREYLGLLRGASFWGPVFGLLGLALWMGLYNGEPTERWDLTFLWPRIAGFVLVTPLAEELLFRGFLMRRMAASEFEQLDVPGLGPWPILLSSLAFGALHEQWIAASLCGLLFALAYRMRGRLADAVVAHMLVNLGLVIVALMTGDWGQVS